MHFETEDGTPYSYGDNATVNLQFNNPILNELKYDNVENVKNICASDIKNMQILLKMEYDELKDVNGGIDLRMEMEQ